jgi:hypothetical protein
MHMQNRTAKFVSAIFVSVLGSHLSSVSNNTVQAADSCLTEPKGEPSEGRHWYYRIEHATGRHCWYLRNEKEKSSRAEPQVSQDPVDAAPPPKKAAPPPSIADAYAELPRPQTRVEQNAGLTAPQIPTPAIGAAIANTALVTATDPPQQRPIFASRWPEPTGVNSVANPTPAAPALAAAEQPADRPSDQAAPLPVVAAVPLAAADAAAERQPGSIRMLFLVIVGALSLAGLIGSAIVRLGGGRRSKAKRRAIWDSAPAHRAAPLAYPNSIPRRRRADFPLELRAADDDPVRRIEEMLAQLTQGNRAK